MQKERIELSERLLNFGGAVIRVTRRLKRDQIDFHIVRQVTRSATSSGANYQEACGAESRADFIHKLQLSLKELYETLYWLRLISKVCDLTSIPNLPMIIQENKELCAIIAKSVITAKERLRTTKLAGR